MKKEQTLEQQIKTLVETVNDNLVIQIIAMKSGKFFVGTVQTFAVQNLAQGEEWTDDSFSDENPQCSNTAKCQTATMRYVG